ncbi:MAG: SH3 domain-containing protein [Paracoccaceae bacterium]
MIRLTLLLCGALYGLLMVAGADHGQERLGLTGAYAASTALPQVPSTARQATRAVYTPAQPVMTAPVVQSPTVQPAVAQQPAAAADVPASPPAVPDIRRVMADAVNVRGGPSTADEVVGRLAQGDEVLVVGQTPDGWLEIRIEGDGIDGYVAARFLSDAGL